jgi:hypothetical protein
MGPNWDKAADEIDGELERGEMTPAEHRKALQELRWEMQDYAHEQGEAAYRDALGGW